MAILLIETKLTFVDEIMRAGRGRPHALRVTPEAADLAAQSAAENYRMVGLGGHPAEDRTPDTGVTPVAAPSHNAEQQPGYR